MPKNNKLKKNLIGKWCNRISEKCFKLDGSDVTCTICERKIVCHKKSQLVQHLRTSGHRRFKASNTSIDDFASTSSNIPTNTQDDITSTIVANPEIGSNTFQLDLCGALVSANIPWNVLSNATFNAFLKKYTGQTIPHESTLRKCYLDKCYEQAIQKIRDSLKEDNIWISVDETTDKQGRYVANLIVGKLCEKEASASFLLSCKKLDQVNNATISRFVNDGIRDLWPQGNESKVLLLLTDAAAYMIKAGQNLKIFYPNLIHVTCIAHALNLIAEKIRSLFPLPNAFISAVKKIFLKAPLRVELYRNILDKELPPEPVITGWGTWLKAVSFYAENINGIKEVIDVIDPEEAESIKQTKELLKNPKLFADLIYIKSNFKKIQEIITCLEAKNLPLAKSIELFEEAENVILNATGSIGAELQQKFNAILKRNPDFKIILKLNSIINIGTEDVSSIKPVIYENIQKYKYAPITSCDVERSFSAYKMIFSEKRQRLTITNLEKIIIIYCTTNYPE